MAHDRDHSGPGQSLIAALRSLVVDRATAEFIGALEGAQVKAIVLKGPSIAQWLYPEGTRTYLDVDVLVAPEARRSAEQVLRSLGFRYVFEGASQDEEDPDALPWVRDSDGVCVDLHRRLRGVGVSDEAGWRLLHDHTEPMPVADVEVRVLTPPARALSLVLHAAHHGVDSAQAMTDLTRALDQLPFAIWKEAADLSSALQATAQFASGLRLLRAGAAVADSLHLPGFTTAGARLRSRPMPRLALGFAAFHDRATWRAKLSYIRYNALPTPAFMRFWSPLARRGYMGMVLAYAWRWTWLVWYVLPAYRAWRRARREALATDQ